METYKRGRATIHIRGNVDKEKLREAAVQLLLKVQKRKMEAKQCQKMK